MVVAVAAVSLIAVIRLRPEPPRVHRDPEPVLPPAAPPVDLDALRTAGM